MNKNDFLAACHRGKTSDAMMRIIEHAISKINETDNTVFRTNEGKLPAKHYHKIWKVRLDMLSAKGIVFLGLEELVESFNALPEDSNLRLLIAESSDGHITFWIDDNDAVIGCIFKN